MYEGPPGKGPARAPPPVPPDSDDGESAHLSRQTTREKAPFWMSEAVSVSLVGKVNRNQFEQGALNIRADPTRCSWADRLEYINGPDDGDCAVKVCAHTTRGQQSLSMAVILR